MTKFLQISLRNLRRNPQKNIATSLAIIVGFTGLILLIGYIERVENYFRTYTVYANYTGHIVIYKKDGLEKAASFPKSFALSADEVTAISKVLANFPEVEMHGGTLSGQGLAGNGCRSFPFFALGIDRFIDSKVRDHAELKRWAPNLAFLKSGETFSVFSETSNAVIVSNGLLTLLGKKHFFTPGEDQRPFVIDCNADTAKTRIASDSNIQLASATVNGFFNALDGEVSGTFTTGLAETENSSLRLSLAHLQRLLDTDLVTTYSVWLLDRGSLDLVLGKLAAAFKNVGLTLDLYRWDQETVSPHYYGTMSFLRTMAIFIALVLTTIIIFSIINSVTITVVERGQEIGMMRALGFRTRAINRIFTSEIIILSLFSLVVGLGLGLLFTVIINRLNIPFNPPGISGQMTIKIVPRVSLTLLSAVLILILATVTTWLTIQRNLNRKITHLLYSSVK